ncbi:MAG: hypothetical protein LBC75_03175 [Fibromonadaceae bacterium]|jgi:hypothetical protein|nr:hypothetical protein [Fibromonadaceae bacterium]
MTNNLKILIILIILGIGVQTFSCHSSPPVEISENEMELRKQALEPAYQNLLNIPAKTAVPDSVLLMLTDNSRYWLESIEQAALYEDSAFVVQRPFHEIMVIITYRLLLRENVLAEYPDYKMLRFALGEKGILRRAKDLKLGPFEVKNDRGSRGLAESPKVPIVIFKWDEMRWKFDLPESMLLLTRGLETIGVKKDWSNAKTAIYLLEKYYHNIFFNINESLLSPVPAI